MIVIADFGVGNVSSIANMLRKIGVPAAIGRTPEELEAATRLILPGVGAFDHGMRQLRERGFLPLLDELVRARGVPVLGICLGMQLMAHMSEEGREPGLGWIDARCARFNFPVSSALKVPHMGWNTVDAAGETESQLISPNSRFYFVHAYHVVCRDSADVAGRTTYGHEFASAVQRGNIFGVQFHPEKSHRFGMGLLERFARMGLPSV